MNDGTELIWHAFLAFQPGCACDERDLSVLGGRVRVDKSDLASLGRIGCGLRARDARRLVAAPIVRLRRGSSIQIRGFHTHLLDSIVFFAGDGLFVCDVIHVDGLARYVPWSIHISRWYVNSLRMQSNRRVCI